MKNMANDSGAGELILQKLNETKPEVFDDPKKLKTCMGGLMMKQKLKQELKNQVRHVIEATPSGGTASYYLNWFSVTFFRVAERNLQGGGGVYSSSSPN